MYVRRWTGERIKPVSGAVLDTCTELTPPWPVRSTFLSFMEKGKSEIEVLVYIYTIYDCSYVCSDQSICCQRVGKNTQIYSAILYFIMSNVLNNNVWNSQGTAVILYLCHVEEVLKYVQLWPTRGCYKTTNPPQKVPSLPELLQFNQNKGAIKADKLYYLNVTLQPWVNDQPSVWKLSHAHFIR